MKQKIRKFKLKDWKYVNNIYKQSLPKEERFSFILLYFNVLRKKSDLFVLETKNIIIGFIDVIYYKDMMFVLYLAVDKNYRNHGYGSKLLKWSLNRNLDKTIYVNIDEVNSKFKDYEFRMKRLNFYLNNNFHLTNYLSIEKNGNFNILSTDNVFNKNEYVKLDKKISIWYFNSKSKIQKK